MIRDTFVSVARFWQPSILLLQVYDCRSSCLQQELQYESNPYYLYHFLSVRYCVDDWCNFAPFRTERIFMNKKLLEESIDALKQLKVEMHDVMDSSKQAELDEIIQRLEKYDEYTSSDLLQIFGRVLRWLPLIGEVIDKFLSD